MTVLCIIAVCDVERGVLTGDDVHEVDLELLDLFLVHVNRYCYAFE